ncbi:PAS domain-containing protein [Prosthecobacter vanneervenii]|uniref:PAS domain S-box-containing protein n=1 Tax=Prosthecobacter vanneervenii TaxID=48466 RepID=A0A7W7YB76_9BACT|nr:PAS domain-containing protein [Prosthecobacter vanneervenii]MBB5032640.1 PAS domain S-box-containing protein [Prosthecobacter vanneervenii]
MELKAIDPAFLALRAINQISAMVAYWDSEQRCRFSNDAYREWFGRSPAEMVGMHMKELLGPLYEMNLAYIEAALRGEPQQFERHIPLPQGGARDSIATYTPDIEDGVVRGFWAHVADVTPLRMREAALRRAISERDEALAEVRTLRGLLPICAACKNIRDEQGEWHGMEMYVSAHTEVSFTHSLCPTCMPIYFPESESPPPDPATN